ncbi:MAG: DNA methyltransferase [Fimbriimonadales bacterium]|nr:DNA methyltransferase [Fimbriimonadales bacterium]
MSHEPSVEERIGYKSVIDLGREATVPFPHNLYDYPTKILPQVMGEFVERLSSVGEVVLDPFAGGGTVAVECALRRRRSINIDINPHALEIARRKLNTLRMGSLFDAPPPVEQQLCIRADARALPLSSDSVDAIVSDIPYADMIRYSELPSDLSTIDDYDTFLEELGHAFDEMKRVLKPNRYCAIFVADYRIARSRVILPLHADVINLMQERGFDLFDLYVWRYYRSGSFRPFGARPYQAMNVHSYILVFHKPNEPKSLVKNRPIRYRRRLVEKLQRANRFSSGKQLYVYTYAVDTTANTLLLNRER